jgi:hypothetical protein
MIIQVFKSNELFNLDLRTLEDKIYYANLGWIGLWIHPSLVKDGKVMFPLKNCDAVKIGDNLIISEGSRTLHYLKFNDRVIKDVYGLSCVEYFLPNKENPTEVLIVSTPSNNILLKTEQILDVNLNPIEIKNTIENEDEDEVLQRVRIPK